MTQRDVSLEARIARAHTRMAQADGVECQRLWWATMARLIARRSPQQIERMERERALR